MTGHDKITKDGRSEGIRAVREFLDGKRQYHPLAEDSFGGQPLQDVFSTLEDEAEQAAAAATPATRPAAHFKLALARDMRYAFAGSIYCQALGQHAAMRELYEGQRMVYELPET